jgi:hypothetical protein
VKVSHSPATLFAALDDPDLIAHAGLGVEEHPCQIVR